MFREVFLMSLLRRLTVVAATAALCAGSSAGAVVLQSELPAQFRGDWVPQTADCAGPVRFRVAEKTLTLVNGKDAQTWNNVALPTSYFGPDYRGISVVAIPDFDNSQPFLVYFNADEKKGVTKVEIYVEMKGNTNPEVARIQAAAKRLATRFPLNNMPLRKCPASR
jgi:hypothetical protein